MNDDGEFPVIRDSSELIVNTADRFSLKFEKNNKRIEGIVRWITG